MALGSAKFGGGATSTPCHGQSGQEQRSRATTEFGGDCDDADPNVSPGESVDGVDSDCNGVIDG